MITLDLEICRLLKERARPEHSHTTQGITYTPPETLTAERGLFVAGSSSKLTGAPFDPSLKHTLTQG